VAVNAPLERADDVGDGVLPLNEGRAGVELDVLVRLPQRVRRVDMVDAEREAMWRERGICGVRSWRAAPRGSRRWQRRQFRSQLSGDVRVNSESSY
jgi:hypothetical protein